MIIDVKLNGVKAGSVAHEIAEELGGVEVKYLPRPYLGYVVGVGAAELPSKVEAEAVEKFFFMSCQGKLVLPNAIVSETDLEAIKLVLNRNCFEFTVDDDRVVPAVDEAPAVAGEDLDGKYTVSMMALGGDLRRNFLNLLDSKRELICEALGTEDIPVYEEDGFMKMPWFESVAGKDDAEALVNVYYAFCHRLECYARDHKRISPIEKPAANKKYAFRCFLLRLGFIGKEFSFARKVLLSKLEGNSAWLNGAPAKEVE